MIQLTAYTQSGSTQFDLDLPETPIELNYLYIDLNNPLSRRSPYSFRFVMPKTRGNNKFFSFYYDANVSSGTFNSQKKTQCTLIGEGIVLMQGSLQMFSVSEDGYEVAVLESVSQIFESVKGTTWQQLFTTSAGTLDTDLDHALSWSNVRNSWNTSNDITTGSVGAGTIVYPLSDGAQNTGVNAETAGTGLGYYWNGTGANNMQELSVLNLKPAIRIAYLLEYIFKKQGFFLDSSWLAESDTQNIYMFLGLETVRAQGRPTYGFKVGFLNEIAFPSGFSSYWFALPFQNESTTPFYDPDALYDNVNGVFIAPFEGVFTLSATYVVRSNSVIADEPTYSFSQRFYKNGIEIGNDTQQNCSYNIDVIVTSTQTLSLYAGDKISSGFSFQSLNETTVLLSTGTSYTSFELISWSSASQILDVSQNFPDVSVGDWLKAIVQRFNLVIVSDQSSPTKFKIEPWSDYWAEGDVNKDWTELIDQDSIDIKPTLEFQKKTYEFTDSEGVNFQNRWWQENFRWIKGKYSFINENDFVTEEAKTEQVFQPFRNRGIFTNTANTGTSSIPNVLVPTFWDWIGAVEGSSFGKKWVSCKPVLAYYNGLQDIGNGATFAYGTTNGTTYPYFAEYNTVGVTTTTKSLAWGYDYPDNFTAPFISGGGTGGTTLKYSFHNYWSQLFNEIYSQDSKVMTCKVNLTYSDLYNLKFNDNIYLDGCFWRVLSIDNFAVGGDSLANAKLIKVISKPIGRLSSSCNSQPSTFNTDGSVNFINNATGAPTPATEACCDIAGFMWDSANNACFTRAGGGEGGGGGGGGGGNGGGGNGGGVPVDDILSTPNSYSDFPRSNVKAFQQGGINGTNIKTNLRAKTSGVTTIKATNDTGITDFLIPLDTVIYVRAQAISIDVSGSAATIGNAVTQNVQATVANTRAGATSKAIARDVGVTTSLAENKDTGGSATITITSTQASDGAEAFFSVLCKGQVNVNAAWFIDLELTTLQVGNAGGRIENPIFFNLNPLEIEHANLSNNEFMIYNLA